MNKASKDDSTDQQLRAWVLRDDALCARAHVLAAKFHRDEKGIYRTLKNLQRSPSERLRLGLRDGRLHPEDITDSRIAEAARTSGGVWISGSFGMQPPRIGGEALSERFEVVTHMSGLRDFASEYEAVRFETIDEIPIPVLPLRRILESKRAAARPKDRALIHALEDALALLDAGEGG